MKQVSMIITAEEKTHGRCLALFPGAFRPPHKAHFETVLSLVSRPDIDEVIIIITNRCRHVPGTSKVLDTDIAVKIWSIYLQDITKVRVELAQHSAVKHAIGYFERVSVDDTLLFCAGEEELNNGRGRFAKINSLSRKKNIKATMIASPVPHLSGGATSLRTLLAAGKSGYGAFIAALPDHLSPAQKTEVWRICHLGLQEMHQVAGDKIRNIIEQRKMGEIASVSPAKNKNVDAVYCVQMKSGTRLFVKYANDTVQAARLGHPLSLKPRSRLYAERRALKWLANHIHSDIHIPDVICFENQTKTLILGEVCPGGHFLENDLKQGFFDPLLASRASAFLAQCHCTSVPVEPLWGDVEADLQHWKNLLSLRTLKLQSDKFPAAVNQTLKTLECASDKAAKPGFFHLDYCPKNICMKGHEIGVIDFELSSSVGDPAFDFGFLLGHYLFWGIVTCTHDDCHRALCTAVLSYREVIGDLWPTLTPRVIGYAGAAIIHSLQGNKQSRPTQQQLLNTAAILLKQKANSVADIRRLFKRVLCQQQSNKPSGKSVHRQHRKI